MTIDWAALGSVFLIALVAVGVITSVFAVGVRGLAARTTARDTGASGSGGLTAAIICFAVCAAIVGYGIYLIAA
ncbi:hypothetical protein LWP59_05460 [Amycolatopsis acidiphila]|uniref:Uncharacterized protein n=1 Tax=Amycolatopsis acidiphila TaxID=715473 RepID=A0A558AI27_9PSEU|nr:hypothetical protein [Amycolatopsis acidiphila]TVT23924.1 hypothetical protein FNH06_08705 [Amycolatopsis acidiphila]UIJ61099.1 hypothetical protein LWP59_05460 [Amycolatopsis acidiphila]GHG86778.1 hypothetical protein GCM10017788_60180 [Amycolatopsis acidiphila]